MRRFVYLTFFLFSLGLFISCNTARNDCKDELWTASRRNVSEFPDKAKYVTIQENLFRKHENKDILVKAEFELDASEKEYRIVSGSINGKTVGTEHEELQKLRSLLISDPNSRLKGLVTKTDQKRTVSGVETIGFHYDFERENEKNEEPVRFLQGTTWIDPIRKLPILVEGKMSPSRFSWARILLEKAETDTSYEYDSSGKLKQVVVSTHLHLKLGWLVETKVETKITSRSFIFGKPKPANQPFVDNIVCE